MVPNSEFRDRIQLRCICTYLCNIIGLDMQFNKYFIYVFENLRRKSCLYTRIVNQITEPLKNVKSRLLI